MLVTMAIVRPRRWWRLFTAGLVVGVVAAVLMAGCSRADAWDGVNQAVADVNPGQIGTVVVDKKVGTGRPLSEPAGRQIAVLVEDIAVLRNAGVSIVTPPAAEAMAKLDKAFVNAGFDRVTETNYQRNRDGQFVAVTIETQAAGTVIRWSGQTVPAGHTAVLLPFTRVLP